MKPRVPSVVVLSALLFGLASSAAAQGWLDTARWYFPYDQGEFQYLADFDGDGTDDLVWFAGVPGTPTTWDSFQVWFNDGDGDLTLSGPVVALPQGGNRFAPIAQWGIRELRKTMSIISCCFSPFRNNLTGGTATPSSNISFASMGSEPGTLPPISVI